MTSDSGKREIGLLLAARISAVGLALASQYALAHTLLAEGRGMYAVCVLFGTLTGVLFTPGSETGARYFVMSGRFNLSQGLSAAFVICAAGSVIAAAVALPVVSSGLNIFQRADESSFYMALLLVPAITTSTAVMCQIVGLQEYARLASISLIQSLLNLLAVVVLVWRLDLGVNGAIAALVIGHCATAVIGVSYLKRHYDLSFQLPSRSLLRPVLGYGLRDYLTTVGHLGEPAAMILVLGFITDSTEIGLFALSRAIVTRALVVPTSMATFLAPWVARDEQASPQLPALFTRAAFWLVVCLLILWIAVSRPAVALLLPDSFSGAVALTRILSVGICASAASAVLSTFFQSTARPGVASLSVWLGLTSSLVLLIPMYSLLGVEGAAWAITCGQICRGVILTAVFCQSAGMSVPALMMPRVSDVAALRETMQRSPARGNE